jgi:hypothetical protein
MSFLICSAFTYLCKSDDKMYVCQQGHERSLFEVIFDGRLAPIAACHRAARS